MPQGGGRIAPGPAIESMKLCRVCIAYTFFQSFSAHQDFKKVRGAYPTTRVGWVGALAETRHGWFRMAGFINPAYRR
jgi:hypothetical protein